MALRATAERRAVRRVLDATSPHGGGWAWMKIGGYRMKSVEEQFTQAMFEIYRRAKSEAGYPANAFLGMITQDGGLLTAKRLINSPKPSDGYTELHLRGRLDLTVEAAVIEEPRWHVLFSSEELEKAEARLKRYGYQGGRSS